MCPHAPAHDLVIARKSLPGRKIVRTSILGAVLLVTATALAIGPAGLAEAGPSVTVSVSGNSVSVVGSDGADDLAVLIDDVCSDTPLCVKLFSTAGPPAAGPGCKTTGTTTAYCPLTGTPQLTVNLGDGIDELDLSDQTNYAAGSWTFAVDGGSGDDRLLGPGAPSSGVWRGGASDDHIVPDANVDGSNVAGPDIVRGGSGKDTVDYSEGPGHVGARVSLDGRANDGHGSSSDVDNVGRDIEVVIGSPWDDLIKSGSRRVSIDAGVGADRVRTVNGAKDHVDCGRGADRLRADRADKRQRCEQVRSTN